MQGALSVFDGKFFDDWKIKMQAIFGYQDVAEVVFDGLSELGTKATNEEKRNYKGLQKLDSKARFLLYQCVNSKVFNRISKAETAKEVWDILVKTYGDGDKNKRVKMQTLRWQFECMTMEESDTVVEYFDKVQEHVNAMRACKDKVSNQYVADKILQTLPPRFDHVVVAIEETRDLETMELEELQHSLEAHEHRINERKQFQEQVLQARSQNKVKGKGVRQSHKKKVNHKDSQEQRGRNSSDSDNQSHVTDQEKEWKFDKRKVRCYNCQKLGHFAKECWHRDGAKMKQKNQANLAQDESSDSETVMLMAKTKTDDAEGVSWYLDSGCSTHMTGRKEWFVKMQEVAHGKIRFADDRSLTAEGSGRVVLRDSNGREVVIEEVLYVPGLRTNLLSLGQLLQKVFMMKMEDNSLSVFDQHNRLTIKVMLSQNRTFCVVMNAVNHKCFSLTESKAEWLWHMQFGHLNFKDLSRLSKSSMVNGLPQVKIPETVCRECIQCKQTKGSFKKYLPQKTNSKLEIVYSNVCGPMQIETPGGSRYFALFIDDLTRKAWTFLIKQKSEVLDVFKRFKAMVERQCGEKIKLLRTNGGGEYTSVEFERFCDIEGIVHETTPPYTPEHNGTTERKNMTLLNMVRCMLKVSVFLSHCGERR